ncbi:MULTISPECIES: recombinase family protein [Mameliella]|uniref:Resolvase/invertase-type recombinase catalytic domain-containing protein n=1 Tax=Mameliella alba TaxID=561184 RepID=A0A0B3RZ72_9RHOB|nr:MULTISPECIES: recombinase family protein [Mameliella]KHQ52023.1 hypothetical protein OA50_03430 [Mameliella alba]MDD9731173.1 recombinase family protein [Mameliella sp. AT18]ODM46050.1 hypothetical protein A9320_08540 [Ruegeria sp. PBVC088]
MSRYSLTEPKSPARKRRASLKASGAVLYLRCSHTTQDSFDEQRDAVKAKASSLGLEVVTIFEETASASGFKGFERRDLQKAIRMAQNGNYAIIVARIDRLSRNVDDVPKLLATGVPFYAADRPHKLSGRVLEAGVRRAQDEVDIKKLNKRLEEAMRRLKGKTRTCAITPETAGRGRMTNILRRDDNIRAAAHALALRPDWETMTHAERASYLQAAGIFRVMSTKKETTKPWTPEAIKKNWPRLRAEIELYLSED